MIGRNSLRGRPSIPLQAEAADCGVLAVVAASALLGYTLCPSTIKERFGVSTRGISISQLLKILRAANFEARAVIIDPARPNALQLPAIVLWKDKHFVTVRTVDATCVEIFDPELGWEFVDRLAFRESVSGPAVEVLAAPPEERRSFPRRRELNLLKWITGFGFGRALRPVLLAAMLAHIATLALPMLARDVVDVGFETAAAPSVAIALTAYLCVSLVGILLRSISQRVSSSSSLRLYEQLVRDTARRLLLKPLSYLTRSTPVVLAAKVQTVQQVRYFLMRVAGSSALQTVSALVSILVVAHLSLAFAALIALGAVAGVIADAALARRLSAASESRYRSTTAHQALLTEIAKVAPAIRAHRASVPVLDRLAEVTQKASDATRRFDSVVRAQETLQTTINALEQAAFLAASAWFLSTGALTIGEFVAIGLYREFAKGGLAEIREAFRDLRILRAASTRLEEIVDLDAPGHDAPDPACRLVNADIQIKNLTFAYSAFDPPVLQDFSFSISDGECVAITGQSGAGKSTLAKLLIGALRPQSGEILIGGCRMSPENEDALLQHIATVMQDDHLLTSSIRDNIDFFRGFSNEQIEAAAKTAEIAGFIESLPMRYETPISDDFAGLSGGQRQRILLARAVCGSPRVLVLDEATSALDAATERAVAERVRALGMTRVIFAHREETIRSADRVVALKDGTLCCVASRGKEAGIAAHTDPEGDQGDEARYATV